jgi:3-hydroxybutyryl-CoA dehydrogenase
MNPVHSIRGAHIQMPRRAHAAPEPVDVPAGVVGMGLMGTSIAACLLIAGHRVAAVESDAAKRRTARPRLRALLRGARKERLLRQDPEKVLERFTVSDSYSVFRDCQIVIESIIEDVEAKRDVIRRIEDVVSPRAIIGSNTSAIPIRHLQQGALHPERILGIHWGEPAHVLRFMEIICGDQTNPRNTERVRRMALHWGKEPSIVRRDIRGFITNRCMYALMREAFHLVEEGYATVADVDRSLRNDLGYWITFAGPFRYMDLTGIPAYATVMRDLFPELCRDTKVPTLIQDLVRSGARGVSNRKGFYRYTKKQAELWEKRFLEFSYEIRALALGYTDES